MLKKLTGYFLAATGGIGFAFFYHYQGSTIQLSALWFFISSGMGLTGLYLIYTSRSDTLSKQEKLNKKRLESLKQEGEYILLTLDNAEIKENNYYEEVASTNDYRVRAIDALYDPNRNYSQNYVERSAIIYYYLHTGKKIRMTSQSFSFNTKTLRHYVEINRLVLYVNRADKNDYVFDLLS